MPMPQNFNDCNISSSHQCAHPLHPLTIRFMFYDGTVITSKYYHILSQATHEQRIKTYIKWKAKRSDLKITKVDWNSHECAFKHLLPS
jgi:hypothetical protein